MFYLHMLMHLVGRLLGLVGTEFLLLHRLAPLFQLLLIARARLLQALLERINFGLQSLRLLRMVALLWRFL